MFRAGIGIALALALTSTAASAGVGGEIAYSIGPDLFLIDSDGSDKRLVYRGPRKSNIYSISMKADGGELSFEEAPADNRTGRLKTISYGATGMGTVTRDLGGNCHIKVSTRSDGALLFVDYCDHQVKFVPAGQSSVQEVGVPRRASNVGWLADGSFLYSSQGQIWHATLDSPAGAAIAADDCVISIEGGKVTSQALISVGGACPDGPKIDLLQVPGGSAAKVGAGDDASFSPDDACFIFITPPQRKGKFLMMMRTEGGSSVQFGKNANYGSVDWRGDSAPTSCPIAANDAFRFRTAE